MNPIVLWLIERLLTQATSPATKRWVLEELKKLDDATTNPALKMVIEAFEAFLLAQAA